MLDLKACARWLDGDLGILYFVLSLNAVCLLAEIGFRIDRISFGNAGSSLPIELRPHLMHLHPSVPVSAFYTLTAFACPQELVVQYDENSSGGPSPSILAALPAHQACHPLHFSSLCEESSSHR